jgi:hypothetical protein
LRFRIHEGRIFHEGGDRRQDVQEHAVQIFYQTSQMADIANGAVGCVRIVNGYQETFSHGMPPLPIRMVRWLDAGAGFRVIGK